MTKNGPGPASKRPATEQTKAALRANVPIKTEPKDEIQTAGPDIGQSKPEESQQPVDMEVKATDGGPLPAASSIPRVIIAPQTAAEVAKTMFSDPRVVETMESLATTKVFERITARTTQEELMVAAGYGGDIVSAVPSSPPLSDTTIPGASDTPTPPVAYSPEQLEQPAVATATAYPAGAPLLAKGLNRPLNKGEGVHDASHLFSKKKNTLLGDRQHEPLGGNFLVSSELRRIPPPSPKRHASEQAKAALSANVPIKTEAKEESEAVAASSSPRVIIAPQTAGEVKNTMLSDPTVGETMKSMGATAFFRTITNRTTQEGLIVTAGYGGDSGSAVSSEPPAQQQPDVASATAHPAGLPVLSASMTRPLNMRDGLAPADPAVLLPMENAWETFAKVFLLIPDPGTTSGPWFGIVRNILSSLVCGIASQVRGPGCSLEWMPLLRPR